MSLWFYLTFCFIIELFAFTRLLVYMNLTQNLLGRVTIHLCPATWSQPSHPRGLSVLQGLRLRGDCGPGHYVRAKSTWTDSALVLLLFLYSPSLACFLWSGSGGSSSDSLTLTASSWSVCCMTVLSNRCSWVCLAASRSSLPLSTLTCMFWVMAQSPAALMLLPCSQWDCAGTSQVGTQRWGSFHASKTEGDKWLS